MRMRDARLKAGITPAYQGLCKRQPARAHPYYYSTYGAPGIQQQEPEQKVLIIGSGRFA